jgi:hypothetical protein
VEAACARLCFLDVSTEVDDVRDTTTGEHAQIVALLLLQLLVCRALYILNLLRERTVS